MPRMQFGLFLRHALSAALVLTLAVVLTACQAPNPPEIIQSANDDRDYRYLTLENGLAVLLVSDPGTEKAAAALDVNIGSAQDPKDRQGLAHFLEHMLFLGTEKYPQPDAYQTFIAEHGGTHNAFTSFQHTNYFFDINADHLQPALDRFSQFFVAPLFNADYVEREINAVHSEFTSKLKDDFRRERDVLRELVNPAHPMSKFSVGNLDTLSDRPGDPVREDLLTFYQRYYSANVMRLAVLGKEDLDTLEAWVKSRFSDVPNRATELPSVDVPLFQPNFLPAQVDVQPVKEMRELALIFPLPPVDEYWREKPLHYMGHLVGHEAEGSLLQRLKAKGWAEWLSAGPGMANRDDAIFQVQIGLTPEGERHREAIVELAFQWLAAIRQRGVEEWRYREQQTMAELAFRYQEKGEPFHTVSALANNLHYYPPEDVLRGNYAMDHFDPALLQSLLNRLTADNLLLQWTSPEVVPQRKSAIYAAPYTVHDLRSTVETWQTRVAAADLTLPPPNPYIPENLSVKPVGAVRETPQALTDDQRLTLWHLQDGTFQIPRADLFARFYQPAAIRGPKQAAMTALLARVVTDQINDVAYFATVAGLSYQVEPHSRGLDLKISGYDDKQALLLGKLTTALAEPALTPERYERLRAELLRQWRNSVTRPPYIQLIQDIPVVLFEPYWDDLSLANALEQVSLDEVQAFANSWWQGASADVLMHGNVTAEEARDRLAPLQQDLMQGAPKPRPDNRVLPLTPGEPQRRALSVAHSDNALVLYLQARDGSLEATARALLLQQILHPPFFHQLRTEQQLGYVVFVTGMPLKRTAGTVFTVQSPAADPEQLTGAINTFLADYHQQLQNLPAASWQRHRDAVLQQIEEDPKNLGERTDKLWRQLLLGFTDYDRDQRLAEAVRAQEQQAFAAYYQRFVLEQPAALWLYTGADGNPAAGQGALIDDARAWKNSQAPSVDAP